MPEIKLIAAIDDKRGLAKNKRIPWNLLSDRKYFQDKVKAGPVLMGWNTYESNYFRPYGAGKNIVLVDREVQADNVEIILDLNSFMAYYQEDLWVVGGGMVFASTLPYATQLYLTRVKGDFECDVTFPEFEKIFYCIEQSQEFEENDTKFKFEIWEPKSK